MSDNYGSTLRKPPTIGSTSARPVTTAATALTSSAAVDVLGAGCKQGWVTFQSLGSDTYVVFGEAAMGAATVSNTLLIPAGTSVDWYLTSTERYVRYIALVVGSFRFARSS